MKKKLVLEDGLVWMGEAFGNTEDAFGEVVFDTAMTDYQGLLTDPSIYGQMVCMTFPLIGNYGINRFDFESLQPQMNALIIRELCDRPNNFRMEQSLDAYMTKYKIPGLQGVDTRSLTKHLREHDALKGAIVGVEVPMEEALERIACAEFPTNQVERVSTKAVYRIPGGGKRVVLVDYGMKSSLAEALSNKDYDITVMPWNTSAEEILEQNPDGVLLSNGPGNPADVVNAPQEIRKLIGKIPLFGICIGHQLLCLAMGAESARMKFGHRGGNNPVRELSTGKIRITSQNHSYEITLDSLKGTGLLPTYVSVNDHSLEGVRHENLPIASVQFHPEASPGPHDASDLFDIFEQLMED